MWSSTPFLFARVFVILSFHTEHWDFEKLRLAFTSCSFPHKRSYSQPVSSFHLMPMAFYISEFRFLTLAVWDLLPSFLPEPFASFLLLSKQQLVTYAGHSYARLCLGVSWQGLFWALVAIWGVICVPNHNCAARPRTEAPDAWPAALRAISCYFCLQSYAFCCCSCHFFPLSNLRVKVS